MGDERRNVLLSILMGSLVLSVLAIAASAYAWGKEDAPAMPRLVVTRTHSADGALALDVQATRTDMRTLSTTLDAALGMGGAEVPLTDEEARRVEAYLVASAVRAGRADPSSVVEWRGATFRIELR